MSPRIYVDSGGEYLIPFAKRKLEQYKQAMLRDGTRSIARTIYTDANSVIFINSVRTAAKVFIDTIRITVTSGWDFVIYDLSDDHTNLTVHFGVLGKATLSDTSFVGNPFAMTPTAPVRTNGNAMFLVHDTVGWKVVDKSKRSSVYAALDAGTSGLTTTADAEDTKVVSRLGTPTAGRFILTDGTTASVVGSSLGSITVLATKTDGFFLNRDFSGPGQAQLTSVSAGLIMDVALLANDSVAAAVTNYTDCFVTIRTFSPSTAKLYRNGVFEYQGAGILGSLQKLIATKDGVHFFGDRTGLINSGTFSGVNVETLQVISATRADTGTYTYVEQSVLLDSLYYDNGPPSFVALDSELPIVACSASTGYLFIFYLSYQAPSVKGVCKVVSTTGTVTAFDLAIAPDSSGVFAPGLYPILSYGAVSFHDKACAVACVIGVSGFYDTFMFAFSDGTSVVITLPIFSNTSFRDTGYSVGSKTVAYTYVAVQPENTGTGIAANYLLNSNGVSIELPSPTDATFINVHGFIDQKVGCRLLFTATYASGPASFHHWDETGAIYTYTAPTFSNIDADLGRITVPTPSSMDRMELLAKWG